MKSLIISIIILDLIFVLPSFSKNQIKDPVAHWKFEKIDTVINESPSKFREGIVIDRICSVYDERSETKDRVFGAYFKLLPGISGKALQLDGNTSYIVRQGDKVPALSKSFSISAWIALGAYPTNWCPVVDFSTAHDADFFLGIDAYGTVSFKIFSEKQRYEIKSAGEIELREWKYITAVFGPDNKMQLYINGKLTAEKRIEDTFIIASDGDLLIGRHSMKRKPEGTIRDHGTAEVYTFYDGLIDELMIFNRDLSADEITAYYSDNIPSEPPPLSKRILPSGPPGPGKFGATYTTLKYYDAWDALWRVGEHADVIVRFDELDGRFVFWRGTSYIPHWVTENDIWYDNEFNETWSEKGCHEPMSDKRCDFSHVRVIENNDARVVIHWRYSLIDNWYNKAYVDETGRGDWTDEVYTIYPDGMGIRKITLRTSQVRAPHQWHESIIVMGPGQSPDKVLETEALIMANMKGEIHTYSWADGPPGEKPDQRLLEGDNIQENDLIATKPADANIHLINTKSRLKPFVILPPESNPVFDIYAHEQRPDVSKFPWWNHWPTAQKASDGRYALAADRASHSSLTHGHWDAYQKTENSITKILLHGLTGKTAGNLVPIAKSWAYPALLKLGNNSDYKNNGYDQSERAYIIHCVNDRLNKNIEFDLQASSKSPLINPAFIVKNWGDSDIQLTINGQKIERGKSLRYGFRQSLDGNDLIIWLEYQKETTASISIAAVDK